MCATMAPGGRRRFDRRRTLLTGDFNAEEHNTRIVQETTATPATIFPRDPTRPHKMFEKITGKTERSSFYCRWLGSSARKTFYQTSVTRAETGEALGDLALYKVQARKRGKTTQTSQSS